MSDGEHANRLTRARLRQLQKLRTARGRREQGSFLLDGDKLVREARAANAPIIELLTTTPEHWPGVECPVTKLSRADAERLSETNTPQGHFAAVRDELASPTTPSGDRWQVVALDGVQDPGNVGGIIRSAAAFDASSVIIGPGSADPTHPRVVRAATGAWFEVAVARSTDLGEDLSRLRGAGANVWAADKSGAALDECEVPAKVVWLFGSEGLGINVGFDSLIDRRVAVAISDEVDSLNVNVAAGIILHHGYRLARERSR